MIRNHVRSLLDVIFSSIQLKALDSLDIELGEVISSVAEEVKKIELTESERLKIYKAYQSKNIEEFNNTLSSVQTDFRNRFNDLVIEPALKKFHRVRFILVFLDKKNYNNEVMRMISLREAFNKLSYDISLHLMADEVERINKLHVELEKAKKDFGTFGAVIEE